MTDMEKEAYEKPSQLMMGLWHHGSMWLEFSVWGEFDKLSEASRPQTINAVASNW